MVVATTETADGRGASGKVADSLDGWQIPRMGR